VRLSDQTFTIDEMQALTASGQSQILFAHLEATEYRLADNAGKRPNGQQDGPT
jgi:hypothetical protein